MEIGKSNANAKNKAIKKAIQEAIEESGLKIKTEFSYLGLTMQLWGYMKDVPANAYLARRKSYQYNDSEQLVYERESGESEEQYSKRMWDDIVARFEESRKHKDDMMTGVNLWGISVSVLLGSISLLLTLLNLA